MNFAILMKNKVVGIIGLFPSNWQCYQDVVACNRNVRVGDEYIMGEFYRNGELVKSPEVETLEEQNVASEGALMDEITSLCEEIIGE